ncbi:MAG: hypothetical protein Q4C58_05325 [Eubacteriales bacterium]|nr:hypothetical protein [Eubacteriales bacterium]
MRFYPLGQEEREPDQLKNEYQTAREVGKIRLGSDFFFFRSGLKTYYIRYADVKRCFRRVMMVPAKLCCGKGDLPVENLVICDADKELAQIQLPGTRAAKILMEELKGLMPEAKFCPPDKETQDENNRTEVQDS